MKVSAIYQLLIVLCLSSCTQLVKEAVLENTLPTIYPDYIGVTIPPNIAPLNFDYLGESSTRMDVVIKGAKEGELHLNDKKIKIPIKQWRKLLEKNAGDSLLVTLALKQKEGWKQYRPFPIYVSTHPIDYGVVYRKIAPGYEVYSKMGLYERTLSCYNERPLIENTLVPGMCVNCHTFNQTDPSQYTFHIRGSKGGTVLQQEGNYSLLNTKTDSTLSATVYPYWHPNGEYIAFSVNETRQSFHTKSTKRIEVIDLASDVVIYHLPTHQLISSPLLKQPDAYETYPAFSPDGKRLYFCTAAIKEPPTAYDEIRYNLCSINFDAKSGQLGDKIDTLIHASKMGKSVSFPRPSYDGQYLMFTLSDYGNFSIWHKEADLWMLRLSDQSIYPLTAANSDATESYHNWSSNSHWFLFSSRRDDGLYTRLYFAMIDEKGESTKPFMLPQNLPKEYYDYCTYSYNLPEFIDKPVELDIRRVEKQMNNPERVQVEWRK